MFVDWEPTFLAPAPQSKKIWFWLQTIQNCLGSGSTVLLAKMSVWFLKM